MILNTIGNTPLIQLPHLTAGLDCQLFFKLEFFNPLSSIKDRIALSMINDAERTGKLKPGMTVIEPTSGNTGIGLAFVCAAKKYPLTLVMPETMSLERRTLLLMLGAKLMITPGPLGMKGAIVKAEEILAGNKNQFMPRQFENPANPLIHYQTTGPEIWRQTYGKVDFVISPIGTGGSFTGIGRYLKEQKPGVGMIAVEPSESPVISGGKPGPHKIQGIGAGFVPKNFDRSLLHSVETVSSEEALAMAKKLVQEEGVPAGISSGAALQAALRFAGKPEAKGKTIVAIFASSTERYLSTALGLETRVQAEGLPVEPVDEAKIKAMQWE